MVKFFFNDITHDIKIYQSIPTSTLMKRVGELDEFKGIVHQVAKDTAVRTLFKKKDEFKEEKKEFKKLNQRKKEILEKKHRKDLKNIDLSKVKNDDDDDKESITSQGSEEAMEFLETEDIHHSSSSSESEEDDLLKINQKRVDFVDLILSKSEEGQKLTKEFRDIYENALTDKMMREKNIGKTLNNYSNNIIKLIKEKDTLGIRNFIKKAMELTSEKGPLSEISEILPDPGTISQLRISIHDVLGNNNTNLKKINSTINDRIIWAVIYGDKRWGDLKDNAMSYRAINNRGEALKDVIEGLIKDRKEFFSLSENIMKAKKIKKSEFSKLLKTRGNKKTKNKIKDLGIERAINKLVNIKKITKQENKILLGDILLYKNFKPGFFHKYQDVIKDSIIKNKKIDLNMIKHNLLEKMNHENFSKFDNSKYNKIKESLEF